MCSWPATVAHTVRNIRLVTWMLAGLAALLVAYSLSAQGGVRHYRRLSSDLRSLREREAELARENVALERQLEALRSDPRARERAVRDALGYVRPGEVVLLLEPGP